jgi:hypothetical protein
MPLPLLTKRVIYLDQFVISNMMKELDPKHDAQRGLYYDLFASLDRVSKLQLIVCPESPLQDHGSVVDPRYEKIRAVFRQLSNGVSFRDPTTILRADIMSAFDNWMKGNNDTNFVSRDLGSGTF